MELNLLKTKDYLFVTEIEKQFLSRWNISATNQGVVGSIPASRTKICLQINASDTKSA